MLRLANMLLSVPKACLEHMLSIRITQSHSWQSHPSRFSANSYFFSRWSSACSAFSFVFGCVFAVFPVFCRMPGVDPHVLHMLWIEYEENWDDWLVRDGFGCYTHFRENQPCTKSWLPFRFAFAPLFPKGSWPFSGTGKPPLPPPFVGSLTMSTGSPV